ncbi:hypothetical protein L227DRAFT_561384 [Lentinus tigrinus ALCF2SS1-6]|uniref:F-box domain-containing protein n=1 Tax=Lentinus tigrinus ALCF2SS1-6 TaxID=1328759 RepID=A0A5C2SR68_9APHY|nr:hypothetical protein L227DRAFT_561384 [Lentinus tigrinus ALCF2SS1-6]
MPRPHRLQEPREAAYMGLQIRTRLLVSSAQFIALWNARAPSNGAWGKLYRRVYMSPLPFVVLNVAHRSLKEITVFFPPPPQGLVSPWHAKWELVRLRHMRRTGSTSLQTRSSSFRTSSPFTSARPSIVLAPCSPSNPFHAIVWAPRVFPVELLQQVFSHYVEDVTLAIVREDLSCGHALSTPPNLALAQRRSILRSVCKHWCQVSSRYSALWRCITVTPFLNIGALPLLLERTGKRGLCITLFFHNSPPQGGILRCNKLASLSEQVTLLEATFKHLLPAASRWESLTVYAEHYDLLSASLTQLHSHLRLSQLSIQLIYTGVTTPSFTSSASYPTFPPPAIIPPAALVGHCFFVTDVTLCGCRIAWHAMKAVFTPLLKSAHIDHPCELADASLFLDLLSAATSLGYLRISGEVFRWDVSIWPEPETTINLPSLHKLSLSSMSPDRLLFLFRACHMPLLRALCLDLLYFPLNPSTATLWSLLEHLSLRGLGLEIPISDDYR